MDEEWVKMYVNRWLEMPVQIEDGKLQLKIGKGTPQGEVISPIRANLYLNELKTHIAYCKDYKRKASHENVSFEFLGFSYKL